MDCLVERVAMIKAGLCDPSKPEGVFLFVGPTGTGKTEEAETPAAFLFGSPERLIRQDMSEYQTAESVSKILGDRGGFHDQGSLVGKIRRQPFAVVLLDEFEKADPRIWDLFLQVFDEGRLADAQGNTADFRHSIFILTSNLGTTLSAGMSIGFASVSPAFSPQAVHKAVVEGMRPELPNRIDRVVILRPLERPVMRKILRRLIMQPAGSGQEVRLLAQAYEELSGGIRGEDRRRRKEEALERLEDPDFWSAPDRFSILETVERMERIKTGLKRPGRCSSVWGARGPGPSRRPIL